MEVLPVPEGTGDTGMNRFRSTRSHSLPPVGLVAASWRGSVSPGGRRLQDSRRFLAFTLTSVLVLGTALMALGARPCFATELEEGAKGLIVMVRSTLGGVETFGAGIVVGTRADRLYIATADHVVRRGLHEAEDLRVELRSLPGEAIEANLLETADPDLDLAILNVAGLSERHISLEGLRFDVVGDPGALERGSPVFHVGNRSGNKWYSNVSPDAVSEVLPSAVRFESTLIAPGSSGGGLFDEHWRLVGLVRADEPPDGVAIRIDTLLDRLKLWGYPVDLKPAPHSAGGSEPGGEAGGTGSVPLETPQPRVPECGSKLPESMDLTFSWHAVEGADSYSLEVDCFDCPFAEDDWYSLAKGEAWEVETELGRRSLSYSSSPLAVTMTGELGGQAYRWRVWAVDAEGNESAKSDWCDLTFVDEDEPRRWTPPG